MDCLLEARLKKARSRLDAASQALSRTYGPAEWAEFNAADAAVLDAERALAAARNEEHAVPLEFPVKWDVGAPLPHLMSSGHRTLLAFYAHVRDPNWDGSYATMKNPAATDAESLALVTFRRCRAAKLGAPNDEVQRGHPLYGKGLDGYTAQLVRNSRWLAEIQQINSVHASYDPAPWTSCNHYVLWFHDEVFECLADGFDVERHESSMPELLAEMAQRLVR